MKNLNVLYVLYFSVKLFFSDNYLFQCQPDLFQCHFPFSVQVLFLMPNFIFKFIVAVVAP